MTFSMFLGCALIAFSPVVALYMLWVSRSGLLVILSIGSAFFWLVGMLVASIAWFILVPLRP